VTRTATASSSSNAAARADEAERRTAVIDLGSNSFRLVVYTAVPGSWWKRTDEIHEPVRIGAGLDAAGELGDAQMARALRTIALYADFCRASELPLREVQTVATSAIRDAANRDEFLARAQERSGLAIRVLSREEEARYGYLAACNSTTLADGVVLDVGGGSVQLVRVRDRVANELGSWPLGAVRMTEHFLPAESATKKGLRRLRDHALRTLSAAPWLEGDGARLIGIGGTVRNLAAALQRRSGLPSIGVQGQLLDADALDELISELAALPAAERGGVPGIKPQRGDIILAGTAVVRAVMEATGAPAAEVTEAGLREGIFLERHLAPRDPPLFADVRAASVRNLVAQYRAGGPHAEHVAYLTLELFDALARAGLHPGDPAERELLWAAAILHDVGVAIDYDDHHKHSRYIVLNAGLPGYSPRETALIAQITRYHRKGEPDFGELEPLMKRGDRGVLERGAALLRIAESLERSRDQVVEGTELEVDDDGWLRLRAISRADTSVARWVAERHVEQFERAFGRPLSVLDGPAGEARSRGG
jgi:exopolyphosphatase/guanosine-5'-triphosphate,3'-diphosphate pyrophosphatase